MSRPATTRLKVNPPTGEKPELEWIGIHAIRVDEGYQRALQSEASQTLVRRIAMYWDWGLCLPLVCSRRGDRAGLFVVDGQHRLAAARMRSDIPSLPCVVTYFATSAEEAATFVALNQQRKALTAIDLFRAALTAGDEAAQTVTRLLSAAGLTLAPHTNFTAWKPGVVSNISGIQRCLRVHGELVTEIALGALAKAFDGKVLRYAGSLFPGIYGCVAQELRLEGKIDGDRLNAILGSKTQEQWRKAVALEQAAAGVDRNLAARALLLKAYRGLGGGTAPAPPPPAPPKLVHAHATRWCSQCDQRRSGAQINACTSAFCKARAEAA